MASLSKRYFNNPLLIATRMDFNRANKLIRAMHLTAKSRCQYKCNYKALTRSRSNSESGEHTLNITHPVHLGLQANFTWVTTSIRFKLWDFLIFNDHCTNCGFQGLTSNTLNTHNKHNSVLQTITLMSDSCSVSVKNPN